MAGQKSWAKKALKAKSDYKRKKRLANKILKGKIPFPPALMGKRPARKKK